MQFAKAIIEVQDNHQREIQREQVVVYGELVAHVELVPLEAKQDIIVNKVVRVTDIPLETAAPLASDDDVDVAIA